MKLKCITTCYGWQDRFWDAGQYVTIDEGQDYPKEHFVQVKRHMDEDDDEDEAEMPKKRKRKSDSDGVETTFSN